MSSSAGGSSADARSEEPPKLRKKPQRKGNIGEGKLYADEAEFKADVEAWEAERVQHSRSMAERRAERDKLRDRSERHGFERWRRAGHKSHDSSLVLAPNEPGRHGFSAPEPTEQAVPAEQSIQSLLSVLAVM